MTKKAALMGGFFMLILFCLNKNINFIKTNIMESPLNNIGN